MFELLAPIHENLIRQSKALSLLHELMQEEFSQLTDRNPSAVTKTEFSIQELTGQIIAERKSIRSMLHGMRLKEYLEALPVPEDETLRPLPAAILETLDEISSHEQRCARQAEKNTRLVLGLMDQSQGLLEYLHDQLVPKKKEGYSARGRYSNERPQARIIEGNL